MKLTCLQEHLAAGLAVVGRAVPSKSTLPVLSNVLLRAQDEALQLAATDLEKGVAHRVPATVERPGQITLPARLLADYVALLDHGQTVGLELNEKTRKVRLVCGRYEAHIAGIDAEEFPPLPEVGGGPALPLDAAALKRAIGAVVFAAAPDDTRPVLAGVLVRVRERSLTLAAADGFRLAVRPVPLEAPAPDLEVIVPARALSELERLLPGDEGAQVALSVTPTQHHVHFACGTTELTSRLIDGAFPDYQRIIPAEAKTHVVLSTADFVRATRAAGVFARDNSHIVRLECTPPKDTAEVALGRVLVTSTSAELGDNAGQLDASITGDEVQIAFNGKYLRDALEAIETPQVALQITGPSSPGVLRPASAPNDALHLVMPVVGA